MLLAVGLALAACSSDGDDGDGASETTTSTAGAEGSPPDGRTVADEPAAEVTGPIQGGERGMPYNPMPPGLAEEAGYVEEEYVVDGEATAYEADGELASDGAWSVTEGATEPFRTRVLVRRPAEAADFSGVVVVEWLNVSAGRDSDADFGFLHPLLLERGDVYVGVSAQEAGIVGGAGLEVPGVPAEALAPLKEWDPERYAELDHPGDAFSYDIFSTVGELVREAGPTDILGGLEPTTVLADGESQSAYRLVSYANAVQPVAEVYDGFLIHSRGDDGADLGDDTPVVSPTMVRTDLDVPVLQIQTETDLFGVIGYFPARQPDSESVVTWELAGTAHVDESTLEYGAASASAWIDEAAGEDAVAELAAECGTVNEADQGSVMRAGYASLVDWVEDGTAPPSAEPLVVSGGFLVRDERGNALGGVRLPDVEAPIATLTGETEAESVFCSLFGQTLPFDDATLASLYPSSEDYVADVTEAVDAAVEAGFLLPADGEALVAEAEEVDIPS